jgi:lipopolysaccharide transport system permease protein
VIWKPELLGKYAGFLVLNPFYVLMETVRGPLLQGSPGPGIWAAAIIFTLLSCGVSFALFARFRGRIAFWV